MTTAYPAGDEVLARLRAVRIVPVITIDDPADAVPLARALSDGGLSCAEITFRTPRAPEALRRITSEVPDLFAGAGTVLTPEQAATARDAGAQFIVAPGFNPRVADYCQAHGIPFYPGIATPTEVEAALEKGLTTLKFFPAEPMGGLSFLKAIAAPYVDVDFMPTGGINASNVASYLAFTRVVACGGSWMAPADWISGKQFDRIRDEARRATELAGGKTPAVTV
ncbi:MAG TPA: bifunctional 4-hydroxy-2-oxoglutarate aldolase/2-dehydro-3-deoxy-phosphogluconate aldolase [Gemmatimonadaceae bacterium]|nr:bifunctional 4-hydroxy-2-oxoglutarate aldolase/2-dehydro-3-deoxy-phosphogluconate aldolase [Gemmatimonadaceae bacterium]